MCFSAGLTNLKVSLSKISVLLYASSVSVPINCRSQPFRCVPSVLSVARIVIEQLETHRKRAVQAATGVVNDDGLLVLAPVAISHQRLSQKRQCGEDADSTDVRIELSRSRNNRTGQVPVICTVRINHEVQEPGFPFSYCNYEIAHDVAVAPQQEPTHFKVRAFEQVV